MILNKQKNLILLLTVLMVFTSITSSYAYEKYSVKHGDSLFIISRKFNTSISKLINLNNIKNANIIYQGDTIILPSSKDKVESKPSYNDKDSSNLPEKDSNSNSATYSDIIWQEREDKVTATERTSPPKRIYRKGPNTMKIALTFDDGPDPIFTPQILKILADKNVKATFFLVGQRVEKNLAVVKQIIDAGHTIGNHSWSHADLSKLDEDELNKEVLNTEEAINKITDRKTALIRPPYGAVSDSVLDQLQAMNYKVIHWSIDSLDWKATSKNEVLDRTLPKLHEGAIILFHSAGGEGQSLMPTINALPTIIDTLREKGLDIVTVDNLLSISAYNG